MKKRYFSVSDIEMGAGDQMDDFSDDQMLARFLEFIGKPDFDQETALILNGDIFDFLKMSYKGEYPRYVTEEISTWKLEQILKAHPLFFEALKDFLKESNHHVYFVIGNHDFDLVWPALQRKLKEILKGENRLHFQFTFEDASIHMEHGHLLDPFYFHPLDDLFVTYKGQRILRFPIGNHVVFSYLRKFGRKFREPERSFPSPKVFEKYPEYKRAVKKMMLSYGIKALFLDPFLHIGDPTYKVPYKALIKHFLRFGFDFLDDEKFLKTRFNMLKKNYPYKKVFVLGHAHVLNKTDAHGRQFFVTDTWRDERNLAVPGEPKKEKTYLEILCENGDVQQAEMKIFD